MEDGLYDNEMMISKSKANKYITETGINEIIPTSQEDVMNNPGLMRVKLGGHKLIGIASQPVTPVISRVVLGIEVSDRRTIDNIKRHWFLVKKVRWNNRKK